MQFPELFKSVVVKANGSRNVVYLVFDDKENFDSFNNFFEKNKKLVDDFGVVKAMRKGRSWARENGLNSPIPLSK